MPTILDGKKVAEYKNDILRSTISKFNIHPSLAIITVGSDYASSVYVRNKLNACDKIGIAHQHILLPEDISEKDILLKIRELNTNPEVNGIIVQLPLPPHINKNKILNSIWRAKDVDGFSRDSLFNPCTPEGCLEILSQYNIPIAGKNTLVIGRSEIVGKPLARMLLDADATVTVCHSKTPHDELVNHIKNAEIIFSAAGQKSLIMPEYVNGNSVIVDISINRNEDKKICGNVHPDCYPIVRAYTPVPGGVGPMTVSKLMEHIILAAGYQK